MTVLILSTVRFSEQVENTSDYSAEPRKNQSWKNSYAYDTNFCDIRHIIYFHCAQLAKMSFDKNFDLTSSGVYSYLFKFFDR